MVRKQTRLGTFFSGTAAQEKESDEMSVEEISDSNEPPKLPNEQFEEIVIPQKKRHKKRIIESSDSEEFETTTKDEIHQVEENIQSIELDEKEDNREKSPVKKNSKKSKTSSTPKKSNAALSNFFSNASKNDKQIQKQTTTQSKITTKKKPQKAESSKTKSSKSTISSFIEVTKTSKSDDKKKGKGVESTDASPDIENSLNIYSLWKPGSDVPYDVICKTFEAIEATTKRLIILDIISQLFIHIIKLSPESLLPTIYLCINRLSPEYEGVELGIGETILMKAIAEATGRTLAKIKSDVESNGDIGIVAQKSKNNQPTLWNPENLTVSSVFKTLKEIAVISGESSMNRKIGKIKYLLRSCQGNEAKYLMRSLEGKLRIGLAEQTVLVAIAHAVTTCKNPSVKKAELDEAASIIKSVYSELPSYDIIIPKVLELDVFQLSEHCHLTAGIPVKPMLAHPTKAISDVLDRFEGVRFTCEYKYDGERAQIHRLEDGTTLIYSRNLEDMTKKYPDIIQRLDKIIKPDTRSFILDCEAVAFDKEKKTILPFQILSTRKRKDVKHEDIKVQVCVYAFDLLYLNGESLLREPLSQRRKFLQESFLEVEGEFSYAKYMNSEELDQIQAFLDDSVAGNCEGLMVKTLEGEEASYEPSKRSRNWLKVKKDYVNGLGDSVDLVVIGAYQGRGKRKGVYGGFLLACYDPESQEYQDICKIGTGFSDADLDTHKKFLEDHVISAARSYYRYTDTTKPDVWFDPVQVWEVKAADLSISPVYTAAVGLADATKGISLRFPRFIKIREDKSPDDATTSEQIAELYHQQNIHSSSRVDNVDQDY